jgi:hypothetical protein
LCSFAFWKPCGKHTVGLSSLPFILFPKPYFSLIWHLEIFRAEIALQYVILCAGVHAPPLVTHHLQARIRNPGFSRMLSSVQFTLLNLCFAQSILHNKVLLSA